MGVHVLQHGAGDKVRKERPPSSVGAGRCFELLRKEAVVLKSRRSVSCDGFFLLQPCRAADGTA